MADEIAIQFNKLPAIAKALHKVGTQKAQQTALLITQNAAANHPWQNETGQAESAFYYNMQHFSTYGLGFIQGSGKEGEEILDEIDPPEDDQTANVSNASAHFAFLENGTVHIPPMPSLVPAAEAARSQFESGEGWEDALIQLVGF